MKHIAKRDRYWSVRIGRLNFANGPTTYQFPTEKAAKRFAKGTVRETGRMVKVINQYGTVVVSLKGVSRDA